METNGDGTIQKTAPKKGRPKLAIDERLLRKATLSGCSDADLAHLVGVAQSTIGLRYRKQIDHWRAQRRLKLRLWQWASARSGNATMQIWLGKNELGQADVARLEIEIRTRVEKAAERFGITPDEFVAVASAIANGDREP